MKKSNKEKMKTLRLMEPSNDVTLQSHSDHQKKTYDDIEKRVSRLIEKWEEDSKHESDSIDEFDENTYSDWGNDTRH